jgi:hypothetical protein
MNARFLLRHTRESGYPEVFDLPGFQVAPANAGLPGMTTEIRGELLIQHSNGIRKHLQGVVFEIQVDKFRLRE